MLQELKREEDVCPSTDWGRIFLFFAAGVVAAFQVGKAPPVLPLLRIDLGLSLVMAAAFLVVALSFVLGAVERRKGIE